MNLFHHNIGLPLLAKELTEQSVRRRTYIIRVVYATALYGFTLCAFWNQLGNWNNNSFQTMGNGRELFEAVGGLQFAGLYLFLPAMTCGVLTSEKERDTLGLLLLTKLGPWTIVFEKLLSRLVPMFSFLLLSMPLLAIAYSVGGVEVFDVIRLAWALSVTAFQVGAFTVLCSAWCRTTSAAFLSAYLIGAALLLGPPMVTRGGENDLFGLVSWLTLYLDSLGIVAEDQPQIGGERHAVFVLLGPWLVLHPSSGQAAFGLVVARSLPIILFTLTCLLGARLVLWRRAFVQPANYVMRFFKSLDAFFYRANQNRFTRGIELIRESVTLPLFEPIRWRETKKRSLGTTRYLVRMLLVVELPVLAGLLFVEVGSGHSDVPLTGIACVLWIVVTLVLTVQSTGLIGLERSRQTLDVLLTTPLDSEAMVREKFAGVWRMIRMLWIPFATVYLDRIWWQFSMNARSVTDGQQSVMLLQTVIAFFAVALYPPLIAWIGFHQGLKRRSQAQATLATLGIIVAWCVLPPLIAELVTPLEARSFYRHEGASATLYDALRWLSPAFAVTFSGENSPAVPPRSGLLPHVAIHSVWMMLHFVMAGGLLTFFALRGTRTFIRHVQRNDGQFGNEYDDEDNEDDVDRLTTLRKRMLGRDAIRHTSSEQSSRP